MSDLESLGRYRWARPSRPRVTPAPCIWAVGSGKGGIGKSLIVSSLAVALASRGRRCVVVDADLGGANLHTMLGAPRPERTLSHFLQRDVESLSDVLSPTPVPNLQLISGARSSLDIANLQHGPKQRLLRHLRQLDAEHVLLDLSAGSGFNVLDFFLEAHRAILAVIPEPTSVENAYHFLKAAFFRTLSGAVRRSPVRAVVSRVLEDRTRRPVRSPSDLVDAVMELDAFAGQELRRRAEAFSPLLIVNQARTPEQRSLGHRIQMACASYLGTDLRYLGALARDESVGAAVSRQGPVVRLYPGCTFSRDLDALVARMFGEERRTLHRRRDDLPPRDRHPAALYDERYFASHGEIAEPVSVGTPETGPGASSVDPAAATVAPGVALA